MYREPDVLRFGERLHKLFNSGPPQIPVVKLTKNDSLYTCGAVDCSIYVVVEGRVKTTTLARSGKECLTDIFVRGDIFGESCLINGVRMEMATAMTASVVRRISRIQFLEAMVDDGVLEDCLCYLTARLYDRQLTITNLVTADSEQRLAATLLRLGRKFGRRQAGQLHIDERITQEELSMIVGTTRSRIGYFLKRFRNQGLVASPPGGFLAINEKRLSEYVDVPY